MKAPDSEVRVDQLWMFVNVCYCFLLYSTSSPVLASSDAGRQTPRRIYTACGYIPQLPQIKAWYVVPDSTSTAVVIAPLRSLLPEFQEALEQARGAGGWDPQRLNQVVRHEFGFLGAFTSARIEGDPLREGSEEVLIVEFAAPEGRDLGPAERRFAKVTARAEKGQVQAAQKDLSALVQQFPEIAKYHRALGQTQLVLGEVDRAEDELLRSLALDPRDPEALTLLGNLYMQSQRPAKAIPLYERSVALQRHVYALANLGAALAGLFLPAFPSPESPP